MTRIIAVACCSALVLLPTGAMASNTTNRVVNLRQAIDAAAQRWFAAQNDAATIDRRITETEHRLNDALVHVAATRTLATQRAVMLYKSGDPSLTSMFDENGSSALDAARRAQLADNANASSEQAIDALTNAVDDLKAQRADLESQRARQQKVLGAVAEERSSLDAQLSRLRGQAQHEAAAALASARTAAARSLAAAHLRALRASPTTSTFAAPTRPGSVPLGLVASVAPPAGGGRVSPHHDDPFLVCTRGRESGGNYATNTGNGYYGAYQFLPSTWDLAASHVGRVDLVGVLPSQASQYDQDELAWALYQWQGKGPWGGRC